jgi:hypothetical protein
VNLAVGAVLLWVGGALLWVATHDTGAATPWQAYQAIVKGIRGSTDPGAGGNTGDGGSSGDGGTVSL